MICSASFSFIFSKFLNFLNSFTDSLLSLNIYLAPNPTLLIFGEDLYYSFIVHDTNFCQGIIIVTSYAEFDIFLLIS